MNYRSKSRKFGLDLRERFGEKVRESAKSALKDGAETVVQTSKELAPSGIDNPYDQHPGQLKESIKAESKDNGLFYKISANAYTYNQKTGENYCYSRIVEFSPKINKAFMYPSMDMHRQEIKNNVIEAIRKSFRS